MLVRFKTKGKLTVIVQHFLLVSTIMSFFLQVLFLHHIWFGSD